MELIDLPDRLQRKIVVDPGTACWWWTGTPTLYGYGRVWVEGISSSNAHRVVYTLLVGTIPDGLVIDHLCRNKLCVNPRHLEPVTQGENVRRGDATIRQTHCQRGHELTDENIKPVTGKRGRCRECVRIDGRAYYARKRAAA